MFQRGLFDHAAASGQQQALVWIFETRHGPAVGHLFARLKLQQIHKSPALGITSEFRELKNPHRKDFAERCKNEQPVVSAGHKKVLNRILFVSPRPREAFAAPTLRAIGVGGGSLHVARAADRNHHRGLGDQFGHVANIARFTADFCATVVGVLVFKFQKLLADEATDIGFARKNAAELNDFLQQFAVFARELLLLQIHELAKREPQNRIGLHRREPIHVGDASLFLHDRKAVGAQRPLQEHRRCLNLRQPFFRLGLRLRTANDLDHLVEVGQCHEQPFERVLAAASPLEQVLRATANDRRPMTQKLLQHIFERENAGLAVNQRQKNERERDLQR